MKLGQASFEYVMVIGIAFLIIVPGAILFYNYTNKSSEDLTRAKIEMIGNEIVDSVEKVYYIGENSWETIEFDAPENVNRIYLTNNYELVIQYDSHLGFSEAVFFSDINMTTPYISGDISNSPHAGRNIIRITSMGSYVLINETR